MTPPQPKGKNGEIFLKMLINPRRRRKASAIGNEGGRKIVAKREKREFVCPCIYDGLCKPVRNKPSALPQLSAFSTASLSKCCCALLQGELRELLCNPIGSWPP